MIPTECGMFNEGALRNEIGKLGGIDKKVICAFYFAGSRRACCMGDGKCECVGVRVEELLDQCTLADT